MHDPPVAGALLAEQLAYYRAGTVARTAGPFFFGTGVVSARPD